MKIAERVFSSIFFLAIVIREFHFFGTAILISLSCLGLFIIYLCFSFALLNNIRFLKIFSSDSYKRITWKEIIASIFAGIIFSISVFGIISCKLHWPLYAVYGLFSLVLCSLLSIIAGVFFYFKKTELCKQILFRSIPMSAILILLW